MSSQNRTNIPNSLNEHWMPFSDNRSFKKNPRLIVEAKGVYITNHEGKKMIGCSIATDKGKLIAQGEFNEFDLNTFF